MNYAWSTVNDCGSLGYIAVLFGLLGALVGFVSLYAAIAAKGRAGVYAGGTAAGIGATCFVLGAIGLAHGRITTDLAMEDSALRGAAREAVLAVEYNDAAKCVRVGSLSGALPLVLGSIALTMAFKRLKQAEG